MAQNPRDADGPEFSALHIADLGIINQTDAVDLRGLRFETALQHKMRFQRGAFHQDGEFFPDQEAVFPGRYGTLLPHQKAAAPFRRTNWNFGPQ
jgi:hypothetical protein